MGAGELARALASSVANALTRAFKASLNMSPIMSMPPRAHWPLPPNSGCENCAMAPLPLCRASSSCLTASGLKPVRDARLETSC